MAINEFRKKRSVTEGSSWQKSTKAFSSASFAGSVNDDIPAALGGQSIIMYED